MDKQHPDVPQCTCPVLHLAVNDPRIQIIFDAKLNEYHFKTGEDTHWMIYYCPFCGGRTPESHRESLFHQITMEEQSRLDAVTNSLTTVDSVIAAFGLPDEDHVFREGSSVFSGDGIAISYRGLLYRGLSPTMDVQVIVDGANHLHFSYVGKPIAHEG